MNQLLTLSRPRFWIYLLGPFLIGVASAGIIQPTIQQWLLIIFGIIFFSFPANFYIYTINDIYDYHTDKLNPKKQSYEEVLKPEEHKKLKAILDYILIFTLGVSVLILDIKTQLALISFYFFGHFYSAPPIRAKVIPFLDMVFNTLYVMPALVGFYLLGGERLETQWQYIIAAILWCMAMHAYSAVPDIKPDKDAGLSTVATQLTAIPTLILCTFFYIVAAYLTYPAIGILSIVGGIVYIGLMLISALNLKDIFNYYRLFPYINLSLGFVLFWYITLHNLNLF
jgi:lycopene elongase/hydratase (dihydrobisanhydrobacterioruberin-forming)